MTKINLRAVQKRKTFEEWMKGDHVLVHLDSRRPGVDVPPSLAGNPALTLKLSYLFQGETKHDDHDIRAYLRFGADYSLIVVPWEAVWGMTSGSKENRVWQEDVPRELVVSQQVTSALKSIGEKLFGRNKKDQDSAESNPDQQPTKLQTRERANLSAAAEVSTRPAPAPHDASAQSQAVSGNPTESRRAILKRVK